MSYDDYLKHFKATSFCADSDLNEFEPHLAYYDFRDSKEKEMAFFNFDLTTEITENDKMLSIVVS
jgi:hypothetical protein